METYTETPQQNKPKSKLAIALGVLLIIFVVLILLVTSSSRKQKRADRMETNLLPVVGEQAPMVSSGPAIVDMVNIELLETFPVQARVVVSGNLPDGCTQIGATAIDYEETSGTFFIDLDTERPLDAVCTMALVPYSEFIPIDLTGLAEGTYTVNVNGVTSSFTLDIDNEIMYDLDKG